MLPGKKYKPEDYLQILWTRKWYFLVPAVLASVGTFLWASSLPDRYRSTTTILVLPQRVPTNYVRPTVTASLQERLRTISFELTSRTRLERMIEDFNLYRDERKTMIMEDIVETMRSRDIRLNVGRAPRGQQSSSFSVSFESTDPRASMQVADRLANMIVQENLEERTNMADSTSQFLQAQLEDSRRRLAEYENKLAEFRLRNVGRLPSQTQSNLQLLQMTQTQIQANNDAAVRERDRIAALEKAIAEAGATLDVPLGEIAVSAEGAAPAVTTEGRAGLAQQLRAQRAKVEDLQRRLKEDHPDLAHEKRVLASLESQVTMDAVMNAAAASGGAPATRGVTTADRIAGFQKELDQLQKKQEQRKLDDERLRAQLANYSARVEAAPKLETDLADMMRDYSTIQNQYNSLLAKSEESKIAANLERRQIGEQFRVIEPARLPIRPSFPNRARLNLFGLMGGVAFGLLIVALLEYRDTRFKTDDDVVISLALPVLAVIPAMITTSERKRARRRHIVLGVCTSVGVVGAAVALIAWRWQTVQAWIR